MAAYATEFHDYSNQANNGFMFGLTIPFGSRRSATLSTGSANGYGQVQVQQSASRIRDWGYQAYVSAATPDHEFAQAQYKSPWGLLSAGVDHNGAATTVNLESQAAVSFIDKGLFPSNTIYDTFAIVDTAPIQHVHVLQENRDVGTTNSAGRLLGTTWPTDLRASPGSARCAQSDPRPLSCRKNSIVSTRASGS